MLGTWLRHDRDPYLSEIGTIGEIAEGIGLTDEALYALRNKHPHTFPVPVRKIGKALLYYQWEVESFHLEHTNRREFRPDRTPSVPQRSYR